MAKIKTAVLASGNGSNFEALARKSKEGFLNIDISLLITDRQNSRVRQKSKMLGIKDFFLDPKKFRNKKEYGQKLLQLIESRRIQLVILAGYMRILSPFVIERLPNRILNIHPSLLPAFPGKNAIANAFAYGCKITGVTVHFVSQEVDAGPIIAQEPVRIEPGMSLQDLEKKIHKTEHKLYPEVIKSLSEGT